MLKRDFQESKSNHSTDISSATDAVKCCNSILNDENLTKEKSIKEEDNLEIITNNELSSMNSSKLSQTVPSNISTSHSSISSKSIPETSLLSVPSSNGSSSAGGVTSIQDECRTSVLIKKQMNEIDKEINRRIQNRNIKKVCFEFN